MQNPFKYTLDNKRYHTYNYYLKNKYQRKVAKVIIDGGFTCPNRDGKCGYNGCTFCSLKGSGDSNLLMNADYLTQYETNKSLISNKWKNPLYIPYYQSFTNTYGPLSKIKAMIEPFLHLDEVVEIAIGTRSDCLEDDVIAYLDEVSKIKTINLEIGLQSSNDKTAIRINRGHDFKSFKETLNKLAKTNIKVCIHILNGLPYETKDDMLQTIKDINHLKFDAIKIHMLHIIKDTVLATEYEEKPFHILSKEEYIDIVVSQLELLNENVVVERITGDPIKEDLITPFWTLKKTCVINDIDKEMLKRDTWQGKYYENNNI